MNLPLKLLNQRFFHPNRPYYIVYTSIDNLDIFYYYYDEYFADTILTLELQNFDVLISISDSKQKNMILSF